MAPGRLHHVEQTTTHHPLVYKWTSSQGSVRKQSCTVETSTCVSNWEPYNQALCVQNSDFLATCRVHSLNGCSLLQCVPLRWQPVLSKCPIGRALLAPTERFTLQHKATTHGPHVDLLYPLEQDTSSTKITNFRKFQSHVCFVATVLVLF